MVNCDAALFFSSERTQVTRSARRNEISAAETSSVRATISFPQELYETLEDIATQKKVSMAWVVREAAERYVADKWPLLVPSKGA